VENTTEKARILAFFSVVL